MGPSAKDLLFFKAVILSFVLHFKMMVSSAPLNCFEEVIDFLSRMAPVVIAPMPTRHAIVLVLQDLVPPKLV